MNEESERSPNSQAILLAGATGLSQLAVAIVYILAARWSAPADYGLVVSGVALGIVAAGVFDFGANSLWVRELASGRIAQREVSNRAVTKLLIALVLAPVLGVTLIALFPASPLWVAVPVALAAVLAFVLQVPLRAASQSHRTALGIVVGRFSGLLLLLVLALTGVSPEEALWMALVLGSLAEAAIHFAVTPISHRYRVRGFVLRNPWKNSRHYGLHSVAVSMQNLDLPILTGLAGAVAGGLYGAVNRWTQPMGTAVTAYASAYMPFVARARRWQDLALHLRSGLWLPILTAFACIMAALGAPWIVPYTLGEQYSSSSDILVVLALGMLPVIANQPLAVFLQALGKDALVARVTAGTILARLVVVALAASSWGALGAAWAFGGSQIAMCVMLLMIFIRTVREWRYKDGL